MIKRAYKFISDSAKRLPKADSWVRRSGRGFVYPAGMDRRMIPVCDAINRLPGAQTAYSCAGHFKWKDDDTNIVVVFDRMRPMKALTNAFKSSPKIMWEIKFIEPDGLRDDQVGLLFDYTFDCAQCRNRELDRLTKAIAAISGAEVPG